MESETVWTEGEQREGTKNRGEPRCLCVCAQGDKMAQQVKVTTDNLII